MVQSTKGVGLLSRDPKSGKSATAELAGATSATISPDGKWVVGHSNQGIKLFDSTGKQMWAAGGNFSQFASDVAGKYVITTAGGGKVHLFDLATGKPVKVIDAQSITVHSWGMSPDGKTLYVAATKSKAGDLHSLQAFDLSGK